MATSTYAENFYIDVHAHVFPEFYASAMRAAGLNSVDGSRAPTHMERRGDAWCFG